MTKQVNEAGQPAWFCVDLVRLLITILFVGFSGRLEGIESKESCLIGYIIGLMLEGRGRWWKVVSWIGSP